MSWFDKSTHGNVQGVRPTKEDTRTPLFMIYGIDCSGSMSEPTTIVSESGGEARVPKIDQANNGIEMAVRSMMRFQRENTRFQIKWQVVELNTYCKPLFETFVSLDDHTLSETQFKAEGSTNIEALFTTYSSFITQKHLGKYNRAVNIILLSDGIPTDANGYALSESRWKQIVDHFKDYLDKNDFSRNVEFYFISVGEEAEAFGKYFAGEHFYRVEESESLSEKIDFVTRRSLADSTTIPHNAIGYTSLADKSAESEPDEEDWLNSATDDTSDSGDDEPGAKQTIPFADLSDEPDEPQENGDAEQEGGNENENTDQKKDTDDSDGDDGDLDDIIRF